MRRILTVLLSLATTPVAASTGISCSQTSGPHVVDIGAAATRGMGSPVFQLGGQVEIADPRAPADLAKSAFALENLAQYWLDGDELRLLLYRENAATDAIELEIRTRSSDEGEYEGDYRIQLFRVDQDAVELSGGISCAVD